MHYARSMSHSFDVPAVRLPRSPAAARWALALSVGALSVAFAGPLRAQQTAAAADAPATSQAPAEVAVSTPRWSAAVFGSGHPSLGSVSSDAIELSGVGSSGFGYGLRAGYALLPGLTLGVGVASSPFETDERADAVDGEQLSGRFVDVSLFGRWEVVQLETSFGCFSPYALLSVGPSFGGDADYQRWRLVGGFSSRTQTQASADLGLAALGALGLSFSPLQALSLFAELGADLHRASYSVPGGGMLQPAGAAPARTANGGAFTLWQASVRLGAELRF